MEFNHKRVLITGGTSGIGLATAEAFLKKGATVCISGRSEESLARAAGTLEQDADMIFGLPADVSERSNCEDLINDAVEIMGGIDILVNSAGVWLEGPAEEVTDDEWNMVIDTNLKGSFFMCRYAIPFLEESSGCIINVSSDSGLVGNDLSAVYCASKGGVTLMTKSLAIELARKNIRVNAVCPGDVATPMLDAAMKDSGMKEGDYINELLDAYPERPGRRFTKPEEVARSILFLSSGEVEAITGACLSIDFGLTAGY